jgi:chromosomal replication initiation ATPase DnaA
MPKVISPEMILNSVAQVFGVTTEAMLSHNIEERTPDADNALRMAAMLIRGKCASSFHQAGTHLGNRDSSITEQLSREAAALRKGSPDFAEKLRIIEEQHPTRFISEPATLLSA